MFQILHFSKRRVLSTRSEQVAETVELNAAVSALVEEREGFFEVGALRLMIRHYVLVCGFTLFSRNGFEQRSQIFFVSTSTCARGSEGKWRLGFGDGQDDLLTFFALRGKLLTIQEAAPLRVPRKKVKHVPL